MMPLKFFSGTVLVLMALMALMACGPVRTAADASADVDVSVDTDAADLPGEVTGDTAGLPGDATGSDN